MEAMAPEAALAKLGVRQLPPAEIEPRAQARKGSAADPNEEPGSRDAPLPDTLPAGSGNTKSKGDGKEQATPPQPTLFSIERWSEIKFNIDEEYLIDGVMPRRGVGLLYGASQTFKSFIAIDAALRVAQGSPWAGRKTDKARVIYLAAEGAAGIRKRRAGYVQTGRAPAEGVDFALIPAAPNLGTAAGDYERLVSTIEAADLKPGLIVIDTVAKAIGGADENGAGMAAFLVNAEKIAQHFGCFVLCVHHTGWDDGKQDRPRGWSGLPAALDVQILSERRPGELSATVTLQKLKDEPSGVKFTARMERVVLGVSQTGREVSTLVLEDVSETEALPPAAKPKTIAQSRRLLMSVVAEAIEAAGRTIKPFSDGPAVPAATESRIRDVYFARIAEKADPDESPEKLYDRQRKNFRNAINAALNAQTLAAKEIGGERFIWTL